MVTDSPYLKRSDDASALHDVEPLRQDLAHRASADVAVL